MRVIYCGQFYDSSGYGCAARGYLKAIDSVDHSIDLRVHPIVFENENKNSPEDNELIARYEFKSQEEYDDFTQG